MSLTKKQRKPGYRNSVSERISRHGDASGRSRTTLFCVSCLRKIKHYTEGFLWELDMKCPYCGSTSPKFIKGWITRPPRRTASKRTWRRFLKNNWYFWRRKEPDDFMMNV